jgi:peptide subunit release factor 1 (eRF1)
VLAHAAELVLAQFEGRYLLVSAAPELHAAFHHSLPKEVQQRVADPFAVDIHCGPSEVAAAAEPVQRAIEEREEIATLQRLIDAGPNAAAWDEGPTLLALWQRRVITLVVDDFFCKPGARCADCGRLLEAVSGPCLSCASVAVGVVEDVVEMAIEQALEQKAALELVRSDAARQWMIGRGPMAALLRW